MSRLPKRRLGDVMTLHRGYDLPSSKRIDGSVPVISSSGISGSHNEAKLDGPNVITGRYGTIGEVFYHEGPCWPLNTTLFVSDFHGNDPRYVAYLLQVALNASYLDGTDKSTVPGVDRNVLHELSVPFAEDVAEQRRIADVLSAIDDKIENNKKLMAELEATARLVYDEWFVRFDFPDEDGRPYRSSGGTMVWNDELKREIPEGWDVDNLYAIASYTNGLACQRFRPSRGDVGLPVVKIREMHEGLNAETERVRSNIPAQNVINAGDLLFSWSASLETMFWYGPQAGLNQHIFKVEPREPFSNLYVYEQLKRYIQVFRKMAEARKTTMGHITSDHLKQSRVVIPPNAVLERYSELSEILESSSCTAAKELYELTALRDWLLPMFMNGQVKVGRGF